MGSERGIRDRIGVGNEHAHNRGNPHSHRGIRNRFDLCTHFSISAVAEGALDPVRDPCLTVAIVMAVKDLNGLIFTDGTLAVVKLKPEAGVKAVSETTRVS